ncbi:MAG: minor capsid protein [Muricomes sp.]
MNLDGVYKKLDENAMNRGRYAMANQMLADMERFVPKLSNTMRTTGHVSENGKAIIWRTKYAEAQFYGTNGIVVFKKYTTPGTGSRWDLKASNIYMPTWKRAYLMGAGIWIF